VIERLNTVRASEPLCQAKPDLPGWLPLHLRLIPPPEGSKRLSRVARAAWGKREQLQRRLGCALRNQPPGGTRPSSWSGLRFRFPGDRFCTSWVASEWFFMLGRLSAVRCRRCLRA